MEGGRRFDAGRWCLELLDEPAAGPEGLARWLVGCGLVPGGTPLTAVDDTWVERFAELRGHIDVLVRAELAGRAPAAPAALERLNGLAAAAAPPAPRAVPGADGRLVRVLDAPPGCGALLAVLARDAVDLLTDPWARARLRQCEGDHCHRVYLDTSRGARRRWCSSETCGNRERVARHRARTGRGRDASGKTSAPR
ncbi:CGNR zinc finger domain-containing protein [Streptomyces roseolilacinus]|uniref:CGNR zinc finger domain-containing protein n=1 Tax=Streptomyces roseolilacinus TaxID=66904 RepID=UPI0038202BF2